MSHRSAVLFLGYFFERAVIRFERIDMEQGAPEFRGLVFSAQSHDRNETHARALEDRHRGFKRGVAVDIDAVLDQFPAFVFGAAFGSSGLRITLATRNIAKR